LLPSLPSSLPPRLHQPLLQDRVLRQQFKNETADVHARYRPWKPPTRVFAFQEQASGFFGPRFRETDHLHQTEYTHAAEIRGGVSPLEPDFRPDRPLPP
ncbi:elmo domain-containing protein 2, partial [Nannochloropsis gaditana CCMP526]|uniref:elmo domain-containing protein 2 n=1 Tax=Nannochloropsis gaditana (strain CCMP526) TaxID=1093141 RepID=UPI00029F531F